MCRDYDSVSICFSKGLGAPIGSVLVGSQEFINKAHRSRKMFGGGWRQAGIIASGALFALDNNIDRLAEDHIRARMLAESIGQMDGFEVDISTVQSNMVYISTEALATDVIQNLAENGIDALDLSSHMIRLVTHLHITDEDIERTIAVFSSL